MMIIDTLSLCILLLGATTLGTRILRWVHGVNRSSFEYVLYSLGIGLVIVAYVTLLSGLFGLLYTWFAYGIILLSLLVGYQNLPQIYHIFRSKVLQLIHTENKIYLIVFIIFVGMYYLTSITPIVGSSGSDDVAYQVGVPKIFTTYHRIISLPQNVRSYLPLNQNMLYTFAILLKSTEVAKLLNFAFGLALAALIYILARRYINKNTALLAVLISITNPIFTQNIGKAYIGLGMTFFFILGITALLKWYETDHHSWLILSGIFCGFNIGSNYIGLVYLAAMAPIFIWRFKKWLFKPALLYIAAILLVSAAWYLKNWWTVGNPIFPVSTSGVYDPVLQANTEVFEAAHVPVNLSLWGFIWLPWEFLVRGNWFDYWGGIGHLFFIFIPAYLCLGIKRFGHTVLCLSFIFFTYVFLWYFLGNHGIRYFIAIIPIYGLLIAAGIDRVSIYPFSRLACMGTVVLALCWGAGTVLKDNWFNTDYLFSSKEEYKRKFVYYFPAVLYVNNLDRDATVAYICGRSYPIYFDVKTVGPHFSAYEISSEAEALDSEKWLEVSVKDLTDQRVTHIFDVTGKFYTRRKSLGDENLFKLVFEDTNSKIYEVMIN